MAEDSKGVALSKLLDSLPTLLVVIGAALLIFGIAGGVTYNAWLPIPDLAGRVGANIVGFVSAGLGIYLWHQSKAPIKKASAYGIRIVHPVDGDELVKSDVRGTIKKPIPEDYSLRIFRIYPGSERMTPIGKATVDIEKGTWQADQCNVFGKSGNKMAVAAFIVGPSGVALIEFHNEVAKLHSKTMDQVIAAGGANPEYLPAIRFPNPDMIECHRVSVKRA